MKKHLLILASLVFGFGQVMADQVAFSVSDLKASLPSDNTNIAIPYTWKTSPYHVTATIAKKDGTTVDKLGVSTVIALDATYQITVTVAGAGTLNGITFATNPAAQKGNATASTGTFSSGTWTPESSTSSVTFTLTNTFRLTKITVDYTPDDNYTPDVPATATMGDPIEAIAIDNISTYTGTEPYVYSKADMTYYALNSLGEYEEYGVFTEVNTLAVASAGITEIEYIASNSTKPYINTGYIHKANTRIVMECNIDGSNDTNYQAPFGSRAGYGSNMFVFFWRFGGNNKGCFARNAEVVGTEGVNVPTGEKIKVDANGLTLNVYKDGETEPCVTITDGGESKGGTTPMYIFDLCHANQPDGSATFMKLYTFKIYEGETLVMDLVPIVNGEGKGGLKDKLSGKIYYSANSSNFELPEGVGTGAGTPVYEGKRVKLTTDNHEYKYQDGQWLDCGEMALEEITDTDPSYKDMRNWKTNDSHMSIFAGFTYDGTTNVIDPYVGTAYHEPYMFRIPTIAGQDYNWSFIYSGSEYNSWHSTPFHAFVTNAYALDMTTIGDVLEGDVIGITEAFPFAGVENKAYSIDFTAKQSQETLVVQFGDVDDGKNFWFKFANLKVSKYVYPLAYEPIDFVAQDDNKYTPLAYIESTGAVRENAYTTTYKAKASTEVDIKFHTYNPGGTDWRAIFSGRNGSDASTGISLYKNGGANKFGYFVGGYRNDNFADFPGFDQDITVEASLSGLIINGGEKVTTGQTSFNSSSNGISMFANPTWDAPFRGRIYYMTIKEDGTTVYDFQPVMRHDGAFGYYDRKTATFVLPAKGTFNGYGFETLDDEGYIYFPSEERTIFVGFSETFEPIVQNMETTPAFTWTTSDANVATVSADGTVTGVARGTVTITATDTNSDWTASYVLDVEPSTVAADHVEVWDGSSDAIVGSIRWSGNNYKPAYTMTFDSGMGYDGAYNNQVFGEPTEDENGKAWYDTDFAMTNVPGAIWSYNSDVLPSGWPSNMGDVYVRRYFKAQGELPAQLYMPAPHDDAPCEYYINGTQVWGRTGSEPGVVGWYEAEVVKLSAEQRALIKTDGSVNVFAYHVHQNWGGRYADGGIYGNSMADNSPSKAFESNENLKRLPSAVAQAETVTGFDADILAYCKNATVCMQDADYALNLIRWELRKALSPRHEFDFASAEPADGLECWLYNVGTGQILCGGNNWGTHASVEYNIGSWPMILHANTSGENRFSIQTNLPNGRRGAADGLGHNGYVDCGYGDDFTTSAGWAWEFQAVGDGTYRIINCENSGDNIYLGVTQNFRYAVDTDKAGADNPYNLWKVITRDQLMALAAAATPENPADLSFFIHQNKFSANDFEGDEKGAQNAELSASKWERNAGGVWGYEKAGEFERDYTFEMWNCRVNEGKIWLVQDIEGLPAGQYYVECTGYYRDGDWEDAIAGNTRQFAYVFARTEDKCTLLPSIMDGADMGAGYGRLGETLIPDDCPAASNFFKLNTYLVQTPVVTVGADGKLRIGIYRPANDDLKEGDWIIADNFRLYRVGDAQNETVTVGEALYATYVAPVDVDFTGADVSAFAAQPQEDYVKLESVTTVPAGTAVVVKADAAGVYDVNFAENAVLGTENALVAAEEDVVADGTQFILAKEGEEVGFYQATPSSVIAAGKGYLVIASPVKGFYGFEPDNGTGINGVEFADENAPVYNVAGQRLSKMQKGINIVAGKKVLK